MWVRSCVWHSLVMVVVVCFRGGEEGQVVAAVSGGGVEDGHRVPEQGYRQVGAHEERPEPQRQLVGHPVLHRMSIHRYYSSRSSPLMVDLMQVLVQPGMMQQSKRRERWRKHG